jgi:mannose-6-phosphate isomerase-like protein (cupin superfamily)
MSAPSIETLRRAALATPDHYLEFLRVPAMSLGTYVLEPGAVDPQSPHDADEVYFVVRGQGQFRHGDSDEAVGPGEVLYVPARQKHGFHDITEELVLLVVFAPSEHAPG